MNQEQKDLLDQFRDQKLCIKFSIGGENRSNLNKLSSILKHAANLDVPVNSLRYEIETMESFLKPERRGSKTPCVYIHIEEKKFFSITWKAKCVPIKMRLFNESVTNSPVLFNSDKERQKFLEKYV